MAALDRRRDLLGHGLRRRRLRLACHRPASRDLLDASRKRRSRLRTVTIRTATTETSCHETLLRTRRPHLPDVHGDRPPWGSSRWSAGLFSLPARLWSKLMEANEQRRATAALEALDDRTLKDMGLSRNEIHHVVKTWPSRGIEANGGHRPLAGGRRRVLGHPAAALRVRSPGRRTDDWVAHEALPIERGARLGQPCPAPSRQRRRRAQSACRAVARPAIASCRSLAP